MAKADIDFEKDKLHDALYDIEKNLEIFKQIFHKISSFLMAIVVLFSTMSFTINMHYCGDNLVETVIFHKAKGCGMEMEKPPSLLRDSVMSWALEALWYHFSAAKLTREGQSL